MSVHVIDTIKPKNGLSFPIVEDVDILITSSELRLSEVVATMATQSDIEALQTAVNGKAAQSDLDALSLTVASKASIADLTALGVTVTGKANASDLTALAATVSGKADSSDLTTAAANLQAQIDNLITPVTQDAEVQNARVGADGTSYQTLKARLDTENNNITSDISDINSNIRSAVNNLSANLTHQYTIGYRVEAGNVGTTANLTPSANSDYAYIVIDCAENDKFIITGIGGVSYRVWAFVDGSNKVITAASADSSESSASNSTIVAPSGAVKLISNVKISSTYSLVQDSAIKDAIAWKTDVSNAVNDIDTNLNNIVDNFSINLTYQYKIGYRIATGDVGSTAVLTPEMNSGFAYIMLDCAEDDEFVVTGTAGTTYRAWAFIDSSNKVLSASGLSATNATIKAPINAVKLIINANINSTYQLVKKSVKIKSIDDSISNILSLIGLNSEIKFTRNYYINNSTDNIASAIATPSASTTWKYAVLPCSEGDAFFISGNSGTNPKAFTFTDASYNVLLRNGNANFTGTIIAPSHAAYLVINCKQDNTATSYKGKNQIAEDSAAIQYYNNNLVSVGKNNMVWSWWTYPQVISFKRIRDKIYWGYTTTDGFIGVAEYNVDTNETIKNHLRKSNQIDDHNAAAIYIYDDGTILAAYSSGHNEDNYVRVRVSDVAESVERFGTEKLLVSAGLTSYAQLIYYDNKLYLFYRSGITNWAYRYTADKGNTWSDETILITSDIQYYCKFTPTTTEGVIRVCMYSNPSLSDAKIRQAFLHLDTGELYNSDNETVLGTSEISKNDVTVLIPIDSNYTTQRLLDVAISDIGRPLILYAPFSTGNDSTYRIYDNGTVLDVIGGGTPLIASYLLGASWIGTDKLVMSYGSGGSDVIEILDYNGTILNRETVYSEARGSVPVRNARPIVDINNSCIMWQRGYYGETFTDFNMDARVHVIE